MAWFQVSNAFYETGMNPARQSRNQKDKNQSRAKTQRRREKQHTYFHCEKREMREKIGCLDQQRLRCGVARIPVEFCPGLCQMMV